jgi:hypothetical protein
VGDLIASFEQSDEVVTLLQKEQNCDLIINQNGDNF